jgi:hypothetical protein
MNIPTALRPVPSTLALAALLTLAACGSGGDDGGSTVGGSGASSLSGTVAVGAPMLDATVTIKDVNGATRSASVASDGSYSGLDVSGLSGPFRVQACGLVQGSRACYYSVVSEAGRANVTPLTNATVSLALGQDASAMFDGDAAAPAATDLAIQKDKLLTALQPVISSVLGAASIDFATTAFNADRTGMDKLLDAVRISTGANGGTPFVQLEGRVAGGSVYVEQSSAASGSLSGDSSKLSVNMAGISPLFAGLSHAIGSANASTCASLMTASLFDDAFLLIIDGGTAMSKADVANGLCTMAASQDFLGGIFMDPVIKDCDFSGSDKFCTVTFDLFKGDKVMTGGELMVVQRSGGSTWRLLGQDTRIQIHVNANISRRVRVDRDDIAPTYTRAISFDIGTTYDGANTPSVASARVYQRDTAGTGWESTPLAELTLSNTCATALTPRLSIVGSSGCSSTWYQLDSGAAGDAVVDNFFKRGRQVKIELFSDNNFTTPLASNATVYKRIDGVPLKAADLASFQWLDVDAATRSRLQTYSGSPSTFDVTFALNRKVGAKDMAFYLSGGNAVAKTDLMPSATGPTSKTLTLSTTPANAAALKILSVYGRTREQMGVETSYVSCNAQASCAY